MNIRLHKNDDSILLVLDNSYHETFKNTAQLRRWLDVVQQLSFLIELTDLNTITGAIGLEHLPDTTR